MTVWFTIIENLHMKWNCQFSCQFASPLHAEADKARIARTFQSLSPIPSRFSVDDCKRVATLTFEFVASSQIDAWDHIESIRRKLQRTKPFSQHSWHSTNPVRIEAPAI